MDKPCLGEVYDGIDSMIKDIRNVINEKEEDPDEKFFKELQLIMVERWNKMTTPLHLLAFALSPKFYSQSILSEGTTRVAPYRDPKVAQGYKAALRRLFPKHLRATVRSEFMSFTSTDDCGLEDLVDKKNVDAHNGGTSMDKCTNSCNPLPSKFYHKFLNLKILISKLLLINIEFIF